MAKPALGRGLGALLGGASPTSKTPFVTSDQGEVRGGNLSQLPPAGAPASAGTTPVQRVPLDRVHPCPFQPRKEFAPEALQELADSIREQGIIQPLLVRVQGDHFELIAGERRWRASQLLKLKEVPVIVRQADDREVLELALIENLQRENLNPLEEAQGYSELVERFQLRQEDVALKVGKSRTLVANSLRLLKLPIELQGHLREGRLSVGHAKVILGLPRPDQQKLAADRVIKGNLNVRQTEDLVTGLERDTQGAAPNRSAPPPPSPFSPHVDRLENKLRERLGTKVQLRYRAGRGALDIRFFSDAELERILQILGVTAD